MLYAVKIGPVPTGEGAATFYCGFEERVLHPPVLAESDADGLRRLAAQSSDTDLFCDPALARAGQKLGFAPAEAPEYARAGTVAMLTSLASGPGGAALGSPLALYGLAVAASRFNIAAPWTRWHDSQALQVTFSGAFKGTYEGSILGHGGGDCGFALYPRKGTTAKVAKLLAAGKAEKAKKIDSLAMVFDDEPDFAVGLFDRLLGMPAIPIAIKLTDGKPHAVSEGEALALAAVLNAAAALHPRAREIVGDAGVKGYCKGVVRAHVVAPKPSADPDVVPVAKKKKR